MRGSIRTAFDSCTFIINPTRFPEYAKILKRILKRAEVPVVIESRSKEHFIQSVRDFCCGEYRHLLVWGGDGTAHDAINALTEEISADSTLRHRKIVGFLRGGSGNGIQDSYEVPIRIRNQVLSYAESLANNYTVDVDLLETESGAERSFCQLVGFGFDAELLKQRSQRVYKRGKHRGLVRSGIGAYLGAAWTTLANFHRIRTTDRFIDLYDGKYAFKGTRVNAEIPFESLRRTSNAIEIEVGSRPYYGRLFKICPDVVCNDGYLDVYLFNFATRRSVIRNSFRLWAGRHEQINKHLTIEDKPIIERYEVKKVTITSENAIDYHVDGEIRRTSGPTHSVSIRVLPSQLTFVVPPTFYRKFHPFDATAAK